MEHFNEQKEQRLSVEKWKRATLADNFIFCKVMSTNLDLCKELLEMLLHIKIEKIKMAESEKTSQTAFSSKGVRFDVYIKDETNRCFDPEMQTVSRRDLQKRARYYQAIMDIDSLEHGQTYTSLNDNYVIFLCLDDIFKQGLPVYSFENVCKENSKITLNDRTYTGHIKSFSMQKNMIKCQTEICVNFFNTYTKIKNLIQNSLMTLTAKLNS